MTAFLDSAPDFVWVSLARLLELWEEAFREAALPRSHRQGEGLYVNELYVIEGDAIDRQKRLQEDYIPPTSPRRGDPGPLNLGVNAMTLFHVYRQRHQRIVAELERIYGLSPAEKKKVDLMVSCEVALGPASAPPLVSLGGWILSSPALVEIQYFRSRGRSVISPPPSLANTPPQPPIPEGDGWKGPLDVWIPLLWWPGVRGPGQR